MFHYWRHVHTHYQAWMCAPWLLRCSHVCVFLFFFQVTIATSHWRCYCKPPIFTHIHVLAFITLSFFWLITTSCLLHTIEWLVSLIRCSSNTHFSITFLDCLSLKAVETRNDLDQRALNWFCFSFLGSLHLRPRRDWKNMELYRSWSIISAQPRAQTSKKSVRPDHDSESS
jgi:hypothetical protein